MRIRPLLKLFALKKTSNQPQHWHLDDNLELLGVKCMLPLVDSLWLWRSSHPFQAINLQKTKLHRTFGLSLYLFITLSKRLHQIYQRSLIKIILSWKNHLTTFLFSFLNLSFGQKFCFKLKKHCLFSEKKTLEMEMGKAIESKRKNVEKSKNEDFSCFWRDWRSPKAARGFFFLDSEEQCILDFKGISDWAWGMRSWKS